MEKIVGRIRRGQTTEKENSKYELFPDSMLIEKLNSISAQERNSAAKILGQRRCKKAVEPLCEHLIIEKALYARISISEALGNIGEPAVNKLLGLLGQIGNNQYKALPKKGFDKKNYPLPRDIVARTICKIGLPALPKLEKILIGINYIQIREAIDAIGYISFYENTTKCESILIKSYQQYSDDKLIIWKIIRAFQAINSIKVIKILEEVIMESDNPVFRWEAVRSLGQQTSQIKRNIIDTALNDRNLEVRRMAKMYFKFN